MCPIRKIKSRCQEEARDCCLETEEEDAEAETVRHTGKSLGDDKDERCEDNTNDGTTANIEFKGPQACQILILAGIHNSKNAGGDIHEGSRDGGTDDECC